MYQTVFIMKAISINPGQTTKGTYFSTKTYMLRVQYSKNCLNEAVLMST